VRSLRSSFWARPLEARGFYFFFVRPGFERVVRAAPWPEPIGEAEEVLLVDGVQDLDDGTLEELVLQGGDA
jgi:hypothetical protein